MAFSRWVLQRSTQPEAVSFLARLDHPGGGTIRLPRFDISLEREMTTPTPRLNFVVQHLLGLKEALIGCFVAMSFSWSVIEVFGD
jgi:hypothetical protein